MDEMEIRKAVMEIFSTVLERPVAEGERIEREQEGKWDSLKHVELIFMIEGRFDIQFSETEMAELDTMDKIVAGVRALA
jgi:acyl carrier protein